MPEANRCLPFVRLFYSQPSTYVWHDNTNTPHVIQQAAGGEQGDPLMLALFSLGQHAAIQAVHSQLHEGESLYAYLDYVYAMIEPHRVKPVHDLLAHHLYTHAHIQLNSGKPRVWNLAGVTPPNLQRLGADVWVGNPALPPEQRGLTVLGAPLGTPEYQRHRLSQTRASHQALLDDIPSLDDLQASWFLPLYCASRRCNYLLRMLPPTTTRQVPHQPSRRSQPAGHHSGSSTPAPPRRPWTHLCRHDSSPGILGLVGRHTAHTVPASAPTSNNTSPATPSRNSRHPHPSKPSPKLWTNSNATASNPSRGQTWFKAAHLHHNWTPNNGSSDEDGNAQQL